MKKLFPVIVLILMMAGCIGKPMDVATGIADPYKVNDFLKEKVDLTKDSFKKVIHPSFGYTYMLFAIELNTNASSLIIDKTKEKIVGYNSQVIKKLDSGSFFFVIPPRISNGETFVFDEDMGRMIRNYLTVAKYGIPVSSPMDAEYIVVANIRESLSKTYGVNYSEVSFSIVDKFDSPIYLADIRVESKSDRNFWFYPTKKARPVQKLTMKGITRIMAEGLPEVHGRPHDLVSYTKDLVKNKNSKEQVQ